jgi:predicted N-formylglutamate amidohydrolase
MFTNLQLIISCEHAGNVVPAAYTYLFEGLEDVLLTHRGWDPGALEIASSLSTECHVPLFKCETTRLLVEPNRSLSSDSLFSEFSQALNLQEREDALQRYYHPHRNTIEQLIRGSQKRTVHLSIHSFTPVWNGVSREVDIGLLFDPDRKSEAEFCRLYAAGIEDHLPAFSVRYNEPYLGIDDGLTTYLRSQFSDDWYSGIEIEVNQKYAGTGQWETIALALRNGLKEILM